MQYSMGAKTAGRVHRVLLVLLAVVFTDLMALVVVLVAHAATSSESLLLPAAFLGVVLGGASVAAVATGVAYAWGAFPKRRKAVVFVVGITLATLLAHLFIIGLPPAAQSANISGATGAQFNDNALTVVPSVSGQTLTLTVTASGTSAIASVDLTAPGELQGQGFSPPPSFASPLQPGQSTTGKWTVTGQATQLNLTYQYLNCYSATSKNYGCIMDEVFYVPEAMGMLAGQHCSTTGPNCHLEHPPLSPALVAAGMTVLGEYNSAGWRLMPVILGTFSIPIVFGVAWKLSDDKRLAYYGALLFALDVMFFSQSGGALLDAPMLFFGLGGALLYMVGVRFWKFDQFVLAGVMLGLAGLSKETAVFLAGGLFTYNIFFGQGSVKKRVYTTAKMALVTGLVFAAGLQVYDSVLAAPSVPTFWSHVSYMLSYGSSLRADKLACQPTTGYWCKFPNDPGGPPILPTDWLVYYTPVAYYSTSVSVCPNSVNGVCQGGQYTYVALAYYGVTNLLETWTTFVWLPLMVYFLVMWYRATQTRLEQFGTLGTDTGAEPPSDVKFAGFTAIWFTWNYVPYISLFLQERVTYPFYFIPAIPAVALGASYFITRKWFSRWLALVYVVMVFVFFFVYFPDKSFLPDWLRALIGH